MHLHRKETPARVFSLPRSIGAAAEGYASQRLADHRGFHIEVHINSDHTYSFNFPGLLSKNIF